MRHTINRRGIQQVQMEPYMHAAMHAYARVAANYARSRAPVSSGFYKASIDVRQMGFRWARARFYARDFKAGWIERGAGPSPVRGGHAFRARHTLAEAAIAAGMRFDDRYAGEG